MELGLELYPDTRLDLTPRVSSIPTKPKVSQSLRAFHPGLRVQDIQDPSIRGSDLELDIHFQVNNRLDSRQIPEEPDTLENHLLQTHRQDPCPPILYLKHCPPIHPPIQFGEVEPDINKIK